MRRDGERRAAGGQSGHRGAGRDLKPEDRVDEIVDHYPEACGGCGRRFDDGQRRPGGRFGRHQVCELPPISVIVTEHRTHQLRCRHCRARTSARLPELIGASPFGPRLQAAVVTLTARHRISRRGITSSLAICSASRSRPARSTRSASAPQTRSPARTASCRTGCWIRARCMSMRPAGGPAVRAARCGPRPPLRRRSCRSPSTATASNSTR